MSKIFVVFFLLFLIFVCINVFYIGYIVTKTINRVYKINNVNYNDTMETSLFTQNIIIATTTITATTTSNIIYDDDVSMNFTIYDANVRFFDGIHFKLFLKFFESLHISLFIITTNFDKNLPSTMKLTDEHYYSYNNTVVRKHLFVQDNYFINRVLPEKHCEIMEIQHYQSNVMLYIILITDEQNIHKCSNGSEFKNVAVLVQNYAYLSLLPKVEYKDWYYMDVPIHRQEMFLSVY